MCVSAEIVIDGASGAYDRRYTYLIPDDLVNIAIPGCRVTVPFGKGNVKKQGMIFAISTDVLLKNAKSVFSITDKSPILNDEMLKMCEWLHEQTFCTYFDAIHAMIPAGLDFKLTDYYSANLDFISKSLLTDDEIVVFEYLRHNSETAFSKLAKSFENAEEILGKLLEKQAVFKNSIPVRKMGDAKSKWLCINPNFNKDTIKLTAKQQEITSLVEMTGSISIKELRYFTGVTLSVINALIKKEVLQSFEKEEFRSSIKLETVTEKKEIVLTDEQEQAYNGLKKQLFSDFGQVALLYGVTGSGKTQVFLKLVDDTVRLGRGVIVMVPEIALTPQMINIFSQRYGDKIAVFHSAMSLGKRLDEYKRIKQGKALIAIGTRSAIFAPLSDIGLIIIDEEQEHTYKSEKSPRFHARDVAKFRTSYHKGLLCLASATPSLESFSAAKSGKYALYTLRNRYSGAPLPSVTVVDMKRELLTGNSSAVSSELYDATRQQLDAGKQVIMLLNRRGHNTYVSCPSCGWVAECPNCSVSLTYHSANRRLLCHYCGYSEPVKEKCPECQNEHIRFLGMGTQKLEEELHLLFPNTRILRLDADSTITKDSYSEKLTNFAEGKYDILLGTQMVAKGLDFPRVSLVGVIGADTALYSEDYRGFERTFSLLTQVIGRAGRSDGDGRAIVQTVDPKNNVISLAQAQNYDAFYQEEISNRRLMIFPPFCDICMLSVQNTDRAVALSTINEIFANIKTAVDNEYDDVRLIILGPCVATVPKVNNKYRFRMIIKCKNNKRFRDMLRLVTAVKLKNGTSVMVDINPEVLI